MRATNVSDVSLMEIGAESLSDALFFYLLFSDEKVFFMVKPNGKAAQV